MKAKQSASRPAAEYPKGKRYLLLIDDDEDQLLLFKTLLETRTKHHVIALSSAQEAREVLHQIHVDLVISDINMPDMSGTELVTTLRLASDQGKLPVILVSANSGYPKDEVLAHGADEFCSKSETNLMIKHIEKLLSQNAENGSLLAKVHERFLQ